MMEEVVSFSLEWVAMSIPPEGRLLVFLAFAWCTTKFSMLGVVVDMVSVRMSMSKLDSESASTVFIVDLSPSVFHSSRYSQFCMSV